MSSSSTLESAPAHPPENGRGSATNAHRTMVALVQAMAKFGTPAVMVLLIIIFTIMEGDSFFAWQNLTNVLVQSAIGVVIGLGLTFVLIAGEFDLSVGYNASLAGVLVAGHYEGSPVHKVLVLLVVLLVGVIIGVANGLIVTKLGVNALVATLGVGSLVIGTNYWVTGGAPLTLKPTGTDLVQLYVNDLWGIAWPILIVAAVFVATWLFQNKTTRGLEIRAVGGNRVAAELSGIRVHRVLILSFVISGLLAAGGGILLTANVGSGIATGGDAFLLSSFAACFLGSVALRDGEFHVVGTLLGVLTIAIGANGLAIHGVNASAQYLFQGALLIAAVGMSTASRRLATGRRSA
jgi:ribose transport system permease protein